MLGLPGNDVLRRLVEPVADDARVRHAEDKASSMRCYAEIRYGAKSWGCQRRVAGRIEATAHLVLHTAVYRLMPTVRDAIPKPQPLATAEFATLRIRLLKIAGRIIETATRVRIAFAAACPQAELFRSVARSLQIAGA